MISGTRFRRAGPGFGRAFGPGFGPGFGPRFGLGLVLVGVPLLLALLGPLFAGDAGARDASFTTGGGHWLGTDFTGRDVWRQVLLGGRTVVLVALAATVLAYAVALPLGFAAALTRRGWLEELLMRPLDVLLAVPSLLMVLLVATVLTPGTAGLALLVALVNVPDAARIARSVAAEIAARPAVEALRMQGEGWWRVAFGYIGRSSLRTLAADAGVRMTGVLYLVATAAFLGVGMAPDAADWVVMVDRNRTGLFVQPWAVVVPALLIVGLSMGTNLLFDAALTGGVRRVPGARHGGLRLPALRLWRRPPKLRGRAEVHHSGARGTARPAETRPHTAKHSKGQPLIGGVAEIQGLRVTAEDGTALVDGVSLRLREGTVTALVGPSGSGKTTTGLALLGEYPAGARVEGEVAVSTPVGYVPQHPAAALNPARRVGALLYDIARRRVRGRAAVRRAALDAATAAQLPGGAEGLALLRRYPHQLSGGQQQRVVLAQALLSGARTVVADEPTTGQDALTKRRVVDELSALVRDSGVALLLLSHDMDVVRELADEVVALEEGRVVDFAGFVSPPGRGGQPAPSSTEDARGTAVLRARVSAARHRDRERGTVRALRHVTLEAAPGECVAVVGRSGSGKTTLGRCLAGLHRDWDGEASLDGTALPRTLRSRTPVQLAAVQYVFQDARAAFDEHRPVLGQVARTAVRLRGAGPREAEQEARDLLARTGLDEAHARRRPGGLSGGELQRAALARALLARPRVLVCDEITSGLDAVARDAVLDVLGGLRERDEMALVLVTHDLDVASALGDRMLVLDGGEAVEEGPAARLLAAPEHGFTRSLAAAAGVRAGEAGR